MLAAVADGADLVIGSRYVPGGTVVNWPKSREMLSRGANVYVRMMLGIGVHDATARLPRVPRVHAPRRSAWTRSSRRDTASRST